MPSIPHPLQHQLATLLVQAQVRLSTRARSRLCFVVWAVLLSNSVVQRQIARTLASVLPNDAHASSHERRLRRTLADQRLCGQNVFAPLVRFVLRNLTGSVTLSVDESGHTDVVRVLTAAIWYQGRAIPLAWIVWKGPTPHESRYGDDCHRLLDQTVLVLPRRVSVTVVADRAFGCPAFLDPIVARGWDYVVRVQGQTRLAHKDGTHSAIKSQVSEARRPWSGQVRVFKKQGWRAALALGYWRVGCKEPWLLVSSLALAGWSVRVYRWRSAVEALFRDWKRDGLRWAASQVRDVEHQERLIRILARATVRTLLLGCEAADEIMAAAAQKGVRRPWAARDSLFGLGRDQVRLRLWMQWGAPLPTAFVPPGTRTWAQRCWAHAVPDARMCVVKDGAIVHVR